MKYYSISETAEQWGISSRRVLKLAKEGRISGAYQISNRWLIPASAEKPHDRREKATMAIEKEGTYKFPLFCYCVSDYENANINFSKEEKTILSAMLHYEKAELIQCIEILEKLLTETSNQYIRISIYYFLMYAYHDNNNYDMAIQSFNQLKFDISQAEHQEELCIILQEANTFINGAEWCADTYQLNYKYNYSKEYLIFYSGANVSFEAYNLLIENPKINITSNELLCQMLEAQGYYYVAMFSHLYLSLIYSYLKNDESADYHMKAAFEQAEKRHLYSSFLYVLSNIPNYEEIIQSYSSNECTDILISIAHNQKKSHSGFLRYLGKSTFHFDITPNYYKYISYSLKGYTTEEMARIEGTSLYNIKKNLTELYKLFKVKNRKELLDKIHNTSILK